MFRVCLSFGIVQSLDCSPWFVKVLVSWLELDIIYVTKIRLGSFFENIWWMDLKHKTDFEYWLFDFRFGLWKKKKENMAGWNTDDVIHGGLILIMKPFRFLTLKNWDLKSLFSRMKRQSINHYSILIFIHMEGWYNRCIL